MRTSTSRRACHEVLVCLMGIVVVVLLHSKTTQAFVLPNSARSKTRLASAAVNVDNKQRGESQMFTSPTHATPRRLCLVSRTASSGSSYRWKTLADSNKFIQQAKQHRQRGTLGFALDEHNQQTTPALSTATSLQSTRSSVDSNSWNGGTTWDLKSESDEVNETDMGTLSVSASSSSSSRSLTQQQRLLWSNFSPSYSVMDRVKQEHETDLNIQQWQEELLQQTPSPQKNGDDLPYGPSSLDDSNHKNDKKRTNTVNSLAEWVRTVDLEPLLQRREQIHYQKRHGKQRTKQQGNNKQDDTITTTPAPPPSRQEQIRSLTRLLQGKTTEYSNLQVKQMYAAAKLADQHGQRDVAVQILQQLLSATPNDMRLYRRLARLYREQGDMEQARAILQRGLRLHPQNAFLWHGMGELYRACQQTDAAKQAYRRAIRCDAYLPHPYHALGTLLHLEGQIAKAMQMLKRGIEYCPTNHRLHIAAGDLYREAKMLDMAEKSYQRALRVGPPISHGFVYTALSYCAFDQGNVDDARQWLRKATRLNHGRHVNAWKSLVDLEEAEGNIDEARRICQVALNQYEKGLLAHYAKSNGNNQDEEHSGTVTTQESATAVSVKNALLQNVPVYRSGDRFIQLYRTWARLEKQYGTVESGQAAYERATAAFPHNDAIILDWADMYVHMGLYNKARQVLSMACGSNNHNNVQAYRRLAELEMSVGAHATARKILFRGAWRLSSSGAGSDESLGLTELYHTWAVCEWHLGNVDRAEVLLDHALRLTPAGAKGSALRSKFLYTLASLQYYRGEYLLAQHCVALCLKETSVGGTSLVASTATTHITVRAWDLWASVAAAMDNEALEAKCREQAERTKTLSSGPTANLEQVVSTLSASRSDKKKREINSVAYAGLQNQMRLEPWHYKLFPPESDDGQPPGYRPFPYGVQLPVAGN